MSAAGRCVWVAAAAGVCVAARTPWAGPLAADGETLAAWLAVGVACPVPEPGAGDAAVVPGPVFDVVPGPAVGTGRVPDPLGGAALADGAAAELAAAVDGTVDGAVGAAGGAGLP